MHVLYIRAFDETIRGIETAAQILAMMVSVYLCLRTEDMHASDSNLQSNKPEWINCELRDNDAACMIGGSVDHFV